MRFEQRAVVALLHFACCRKLRHGACSRFAFSSRGVELSTEPRTLLNAHGLRSLELPREPGAVRLQRGNLVHERKALPHCTLQLCDALFRIAEDAAR